MKRTVALLTCLALMIPGAAVALANSTNSTYGQSGVHNVTGSSTPSGKSTETTSTGSLPFTGLDLAALAAGGMLLLGAGLVLRRVSATDAR
jgi:hypothetical protein